MKYDIEQVAQIYQPFHEFMYSVLHDAHIYYNTSVIGGASIHKIALATFTIADSLPTGATGAAAGVVVDGTHLYSAGDIGFADYTKITKTALATFSIVTTLNLTQDAPHTDCAALVAYGGNLYAALEGGVGKVRLSDFTEVDFLNLGGRHNTGLDTKDGFLYIADFDAEPSIIYKIDLSDFTTVVPLTLNAGEDNAFALHISGNDLYCGCKLAPARIIKIDLTTFTRTAAITLSNINTYYFWLADAITSDAEFLYVTHGLGTGAYITLIHLASFGRVDQVYRAGIAPDAEPNIIYNDGYIYLGEDTLVRKLSVKKIIYGAQII